MTPAHFKFQKYRLHHIEKKKKKEDKHQYGGFLEKYNMKMKIPSPLKDFMSLMNRISFQKQGFIFVRSNNA